MKGPPSLIPTDLGLGTSSRLRSLTNNLNLVLNRPPFTQLGFHLIYIDRFIYVNVLFISGLYSILIHSFFENDFKNIKPQFVGICINLNEQ